MTRIYFFVSLSFFALYLSESKKNIVNVALDKYAPYAKINKTGLVVTATYNGTETKTVDAKDYDATLGTITTKATDLSSFAALDWATDQLSTDITGKDVVVKISMDNTSAAAMYKVDFKENLISSIYVDVDEDYKFYYDMDKTGLDTTDKLKADKVTVLANMVNGQAGAAVTGINICGTKDNTGENISTMNPFCSELTGIYWAWKNAQKTDYIGFEAYRRHFNLNKELVLDILADHDIILPTPINLGKETNKEFYNRVNIGKDFDAVGEIIKESYPEYAEDWEKHLVNGRLLYYGNGFVTSYENFTKMAEFIFGILDRYMVRMGFQTLGDVRKYVEESKQTMMPLDHMRQGMTPVDYQMKIGAFLTERLITLYALHNFSKIYHVKYEDLDGIYRKIETRTLLCTIGRLENRYAKKTSVTQLATTSIPDMLYSRTTETGRSANLKHTMSAIRNMDRSIHG